MENNTVATLKFEGLTVKIIIRLFIIMSALYNALLMNVKYFFLNICMSLSGSSTLGCTGICWNVPRR